MGLFRFEREDEIAELNGCQEPEWVPCPNDACDRIATAVRKDGMASINTHGAVSMGKGFGAAIDTLSCRVNLSSVEEILGDEFIYSYDEDRLYVFKKGLSKDEFLKAVGITDKQEDLKRTIGFSPWDPITVKLIPREEAVERECKTGIINNTGKFVCRYEFRKAYDIKGDNSPYVVDVAGTRVNDIPCSTDNWYIPVKDCIDKDMLDIVIKNSGLDGVELDIPNEETLNRNMEAYTADILSKIEASIQKFGFADIATFGRKAVRWRAKYMPEEYVVIHDDVVIHRSADLVEIAVKLGYKREQLSSTAPTKFWDRYVVITQDGIRVVNTDTKDPFEYADPSLRGKVFHTKVTEAMATKEAIMARFKELSIDPYEVTKLTTVWHYINFAAAVVELLNRTPGVVVRDDDISVLQPWYKTRYPLRAERFKRNCLGEMRANHLTHDNMLKILTAVKNIAVKLEVSVRDPEATLKAAEERYRR